MASLYREKQCSAPRESLVHMALTVAASAKEARRSLDKWLKLRDRLPDATSELVEATLLRSIITSGNCTDDALPAEFFRDSMTTVALEGASKLSSAAIKEGLLKCPNVTELHLAGCFYVTDGTVRTILESCTKIKALTLEGCKKLSDASISSLIELSPNLEVLDLGGCYNLTSPGVEKLVQTHPNAAKFRVLHLSGLGVPGLGEKLIENIGVCCPQLESLGLGYSQITDSSLWTLLSKCKHIKRLELHWCSGITDAGLNSIAELCPSIESLVLTGCRSVTDGGIQAVVRARSPSYASSFSDGMRFKTAAVRFTSVTTSIQQHIQDQHPKVRISM